ncbi:helix-turn-helix domain-containing protein [Nocardiopsis changdeensis]|uniref:Helix-turn-helix transcriptional regulator n=1 Tax=Nocardiopsis changdeensis TaxID=2831969 RepID=A0ABX8BTZ5_9ACTN|nr:MULTISPECIES: helix-turn-helix transcriptional regulator [Nocardiopsis]QUX24562.1 helix-turn-helix transcriptional regulator [Nocardiopsis changdeensis]QYX34950.1 helix-turn-helix transcriptional regulator [Nocardiopsis sp. MT53]
MPQNPHKQWISFGQEIRRNRLELGISQAELGKRIQVSGAMVGHLERAIRVATRDQVDALEAVFATEGSLLRRWSSAIKSRSVPDWFQNALASEGRAEQTFQYQSILVPGLLQIPSYAEALVRAWQPQASDEEVDQIVQTRTRRLAALLPRKAALWFVVDEVVVTHPVGSLTVMADQLEHIAELADRRSIRFQVLPQRLLHPGICPPFRLMFLREEQAVVFVEHALGDVARSGTQDVAHMRTLFGAMQADALPPSDSIERIREIRKDLMA